MRNPIRKSILNRLTAKLIVLVSFAAVLPAAWAQTAPPLGTAASFAVLGGQTVTNTGPSQIFGDLGVWPGTAITGFPPGLIVAPGAQHASDAVAHNAQLAVTAAYNNLAGQPCQFNLTGTDLGGLTLVAGVYCFTSSAQLTGTLTLDGQGDPDAVFIFQIGSTLTTSVNSNVVMINGARDCNVFWQVGSSATLFTNTRFIGNILALTNIALQSGTELSGRALARNAAVTLDNNKVGASACSVSTTCTDTTKPTIVVTRNWDYPGTSFYYTVQDTGCGLASIFVDSSINLTITIPPFTQGTTLPVVVTATVIDENYASGIGVVATDVNGNQRVFDPVSLTLRRSRGQPEPVTVTGVPREEHFIDIVNGRPGLNQLRISVNGTEVWSGNLMDDQSRTVNIGQAMELGNDNTVTFEFHGQPGGSAAILIRPSNDN